MTRTLTKSIGAFTWKIINLSNASSEEVTEILEDLDDMEYGFEIVNETIYLIYRPKDYFLLPRNDYDDESDDEGETECHV